MLKPESQKQISQCISLLLLTALALCLGCLPNPEPFTPNQSATGEGQKDQLETEQLADPAIGEPDSNSISDSSGEVVSPTSPLLEDIKLVSTNAEDGITIETYAITYKSDGLLIKGYLVKPQKGDNFPVFIYNRPGKGDKGLHGKTSLKLQRTFASNGYLVLSTQLRGNKHTEGIDEMGGKDLNDILQLIEIGKTLNCVQPDKIVMYGLSRGGVNAYQVSRVSDDIKAFAVVGSSIDLRIDFSLRPKLYKSVYRKLLGDSVKNRAAYEARSPRYWVDEINEPFLILHGDADKIVPVKNASIMANTMKANGQPHKLKIFKKGDHNLSNFLNERNALILDWFAKYLNE